MAAQKLAILNEFAQRLSDVYSAIAKNINNVVQVLNVTEADKDIKISITQIIASLEALEKSIFVERKLTDERQILKIIARQISDIKKLEAYLRLSVRQSDHRVIRAINNLNTELTKLFAAEAADIKMAA